MTAPTITVIVPTIGRMEYLPATQSAFAGSNFAFIDVEGKVIDLWRWIKRTEWWSGARNVSELVARGRKPVPMPGLVFRRDAFPAHGFDESLPIHFGDFVLLLRAAEECERPMNAA